MAPPQDPVGTDQGAPAVQICFVCLGNICRSPTAAGVMRDRVRRAGLGDHIGIDSAGTGAWHVGEPPDARATAEARARGIDLDDAARQFVATDLDRFDLVLAMDDDNVAAIRSLATQPHHHGRIRLLRDFDPGSPDGSAVPDPYYGGDHGFADVFDLVDAACAGLVDHLVAEHDLPRA